MPPPVRRGRADRPIHKVDAIAPGTLGSFTAFAKRFCNAHRDRFGWNTKARRVFARTRRPGRNVFSLLRLQGASHLDELHTLLRDGIMVRRLKRNVLDQLPPKRRQASARTAFGKGKSAALTSRRQRVPLEIADAAAVAALKSQFAALEALSADEHASKMDHHRALTALYGATSEAKTAAVCDYVRTLCRAGAKFLVFGCAAAASYLCAVVLTYLCGWIATTSPCCGRSRRASKKRVWPTS